jgi:hypothetical protein
VSTCQQCIKLIPPPPNIARQKGLKEKIRIIKEKIQTEKENMYVIRKVGDNADNLVKLGENRSFAILREKYIPSFVVF